MLARWLGLERRRLRPLEEAVIDAVLGRLEGEARERLARQVESINLVQRHAGAKEVNCYPIRWGRPHREDAIRFADRRSEASLARVSFRTGDESREGRAVVGLVGGYFFSIHFDRPPPDVPTRERLEITGVDLLTDPMVEKVESEEGAPPSIESLCGVLASWGGRHGISSASAPLPEGARNELIESIQATLPPDYLELVEQLDGFRVGGVSVLGLREVYKVSLPDSDCWVLADLSGEGVVCVRESDDPPGLCFLDYHGDRPVPLASFVSAVEAFLDGGTPALRGPRR